VSIQACGVLWEICECFNFTFERKKSTSEVEKELRATWLLLKHPTET
jgi:hypothetical protein